MKTKGQITWFIIVGIVILLGSIFLIIYNQQRTEIEPLLQAPEDQISRYVSSCVDQGLKKGLALMSIQGGHIFIPLDEPLLNVKDPFNRQVEGNKVIEGSNPNLIPYWVRATRPSIPTLKFLEEELKNFLFEEFD